MSLELRVECDDCGADLVATAVLQNEQVVLLVTPCETCRERNYEAGYTDGKSEGRNGNEEHP